MKNTRLGLLTLLLLFATLSVQARPHGLYGSLHPRPLHSIVIGGAGSYYYGDVETQNFSLSRGFAGENFGFNGQIIYRYSFNEYLRLRAGLQIGSLRADNSKVFVDAYPGGKAYRKFTYVYGMPQIGVEWYPAGKMFYIYAGAELVVSNINFDFSSATGVQTKSSSISTLPTLGIELGLDIRVTKNFTIVPFIAVHQGLAEAPGMNLDGWPSVPVTASNGMQYAYGSSKGNKMLDGFFQIGVSFSFGWYKKSTCHCAED